MKVSIKILFTIFTIFTAALFLSGVTMNIWLHRLNNITELWTKPLQYQYGASGFSENRVVAISAYFDPRSQQSHNNATVILLPVEKSLKNSIVGCEKWMDSQVCEFICGGAVYYDMAPCCFQNDSHRL